MTSLGAKVSTVYTIDRFVKITHNVSSSVEAGSIYITPWFFDFCLCDWRVMSGNLLFLCRHRGELLQGVKKLNKVSKDEFHPFKFSKDLAFSWPF